MPLVHLQILLVMIYPNQTTKSYIIILIKKLILTALTTSFCFCLHNSKTLTTSPDLLHLISRILISAAELNDEMNEWACVPLTGIPNNFPANKLDVASKPNRIYEFKNQDNK